MIDRKHGKIEFERRVFPRFTLNLPFSYEVDATQSGQGETQDASQGGLQVFIADYLKPESILKLHLSLSEKKTVKYIDALARVVWITPAATDGKKYKAGLEFVEISDDGLKYLRWFQQLWLTQT